MHLIQIQELETEKNTAEFNKTRAWYIHLLGAINMSMCTNGEIILEVGPKALTKCLSVI